MGQPMSHGTEAPDVRAWFEGGAADGITLRENVQAWQRIRLLPRVLRPLAGSHTRVRLLGREWPGPVLVAPMAYQTAVHPQGEQATALAASALGAGLVLSCQAGTPLAQVARLHLGDPARGPLWLQLYLQADRTDTLALVRQAEAAGYEALVLTVDAPVQGPRDHQAGFRLPPGVAAVNLPPPRTEDLTTLLARAPGWDDLAWLRENTRLPVLLKGVLHPADARLAVEHGAAGLIVSNHGGRNLDTAWPTAAALPAVVRAVQGRVPVLVDGGIRRGTDVLKALGLGASAVLLGRPVLAGLAADGATGVARVLRCLHDELAMAMALCGCRTLAEAGEALASPEDFSAIS
jgi:4-hydroxymandelate oxidase